MNSSARKKKNIMCAFHYIRQTGSLFEREGGESTSCVLFMANKVVSASKLKTQKFRSFTIEELGKFGGSGTYEVCA